MSGRTNGRCPICLDCCLVYRIILRYNVKITFDRFENVYIATSVLCVESHKLLNILQHMLCVMQYDTLRRYTWPILLATKRHFICKGSLTECKIRKENLAI